jgi:hypothetical protein
LLVILLYFVASVFIVIGFLLLFGFYRTRRWEMVIMSFVYSASGLAAGYSLQWWPLVAGFVVVWLLKIAGYDPDRPQKTSASEPASASDQRIGKE